nr:hypothetical protein [Bartonella henselae]
MRTPHYLKDVAVGAFENHTAELKGDEDRNWFSLLRFYILLK